MDTFYEPAVAPPTDVDARRPSRTCRRRRRWHTGSRRAARCTRPAARGSRPGAQKTGIGPGQRSVRRGARVNLEGGLKSTWATGGSRPRRGVPDRLDDMQLPVRTRRCRAVLHRQRRAARDRPARGRDERPAGRGVDLFASAGLTRARFSDGSTSGGADVAGNEAAERAAVQRVARAQLSQTVGADYRCFRPRDVVFSGAYHYDRSEYGRAGGLFAGQPARRPEGPAVRGRGLGEERVRHPLPSRSPSRTRRPRRQASWARTAVPGRSGSASASVLIGWSALHAGRTSRPALGQASSSAHWLTSTVT